MEPVEILREIRMARPESKTSVAVLRDDVLDDGRRLGQNQIAIGDDRRGAERVEGPEFRRRQTGDGIARVVLQLVVNPEFLAEPDDPLRLRHTKMMNYQHVRLSAGKDPEATMAEVDSAGDNTTFGTMTWTRMLGDAIMLFGSAV